MTDLTPRARREFAASISLDIVASQLYAASQVYHEQPLPPWYESDAKAMREDCRYRARGAHKRGDQKARFAVIERVAVVLAVANGDIWPACDNQIHRGLPEERRAVIAAMRRQRYRHQANLVCAEVARFYEVDQDTPEMLSLIIDTANQQRDADAGLVAAYRSRVGKGEVVAIGRQS